MLGLVISCRHATDDNGDGDGATDDDDNDDDNGDNCNGTGKVGDGRIVMTCPVCKGTGKKPKPAAASAPCPNGRCPL